MTTLSRFQILSWLRALLSVPLTNFAAGRMGMNAGKLVTGYYSRSTIDYTRRAFGPFLVPASGTTHVALDTNGNPAASYEVVLSANPVAADLGVYNCWCDGQISGVAASTSTTTTVVSFSTPVYTSADNKTRFQMTLTSGGGTLGVVVSNPTASSYLRILPATINGVAVTEAQSNDFHPDAIAQNGLGTTIRAIDWVTCNSPINVAETTWAASVAAGTDGSIRLLTQGLAEFCRFAKACGANAWLNMVPLATDAYVTQYVTLADSATLSSAIINLEWADEIWNQGFNHYDLMTQAAMRLAATYGGNIAAMPTSTNAIKSCTRDGTGTATAVITGSPRNGTSAGFKAYVAGITNITGGLVTLTASVNNGDGTWSISWAETGAAVTGTVQSSSHSYNSYIHTDVETGAVHYLVKGLTTYGAQPSPNFVTPYSMKGRYVVERLRAAYNIIQTLPGKARWRLWMNNKFGGGTGDGLSENEVFPYAFERFGDHSWLAGVAAAPYFASEAAAQAAPNAQGVITALSSALDVFPQLFVREGNAALSWGHVKGYYEGGPGSTNIGANGANIGQAHSDATLTPNMGSLITRMFQYARDLGQTAPFCYYGGGAVAQFGSANNTMWALDQNGTPGDLTQVKPAAVLAWGAASSQAAPMDGWNSGTIIMPTVWFSSYGSGDANNCRIAGPTVVLGDAAIQVTKTIAGNYPLAVYACSTSSSDTITILVNGVAVATSIPLTLNNPTASEPSTPVWSSAAYPMNAGTNVVIPRIQSTGRVGTIGYNKIISPDTPV
jgi:hypothetical protein